MRLIVLLLCVASISAYADVLDKFAIDDIHVNPSDFPECDNAEYAKSFQSQYPKELQKALTKMKEDDKKEADFHIANIEKIKTKVIDAGIWTKQDASMYFLSLVNADDTKAIEDKKKILSKDFKIKNNGITVLTDILGYGKPEMINRGTCIFGKSAINDAMQANLVNKEAWLHLEQKMIDFATGKNVRISE